MTIVGLHVGPIDLPKYAPPTQGGAYRIGPAARLVGVSPSALRRWERHGLLQPRRTGGGYRLYSEADLAQLRRIRAMRADHVNVQGIRRLLADAPDHRQPGPGGLDGGLLGRRRRALRLTLRQAGARAHLSASFISAVERNAATASVAALQRLTHAYGTTVAELLSQSRGGRRVRPRDRPLMTLGHEVRIEQLAVGASQLEPQLFVLGPGASSAGAYAHDGEEFLYVLDGGLTVWLGDRERYPLAAGDALTFPSTLPHRWRNRAHGETRLLWINTPPTF
jgi:DNA-binding transcriptional MerR regulator